MLQFDHKDFAYVQLAAHSLADFKVKLAKTNHRSIHRDEVPLTVYQIEVRR